MISKKKKTLSIYCFYLTMLIFTILLLCGSTASVFDADIHEKYKTLPIDEFIQYFNGLNLSWNITEHKHLKGSKPGYAKISKDVKLSVKYLDAEAFTDLPVNFDPRQKWPQCETLNDIYDQHQGTQCGSCWTFGSATTASDRTCIHAGLSVRLAEQDLQCCRECLAGETVCNGGFPESAFEFWRDEGLVTQKCKPYDIKELYTAVCKTECKNSSIDYKNDKHYGGELYNVPGDNDAIRAELFNNGPVEAVISVFEDFFLHYSGGIYEHKFGKYLAEHSVRVLGYGVENGVEYWLGANSWGKVWGEKGFFRIKRYQEDIGFEDSMFTGKPKN